MKDINLLVGLISTKKQFDIRKSGKKATVVIVLLAFLLGAVFGVLKYLSNMHNEKIDELRSEMTAYSEVTQVKSEIQSGKKQLNSIRDLLSVTAASSRVTTQLFDTVGSSMDDAVFLTSLAFNENGTVSFSGKAATRLDITYFIYSLKETGVFSEVTVSAINSEKHSGSEEPSAYNFTATAVVKEAAEIE